ncbi:unnamed protein product, partial [Medioppia subpectinata]
SYVRNGVRIADRIHRSFISRCVALSQSSPIERSLRCFGLNCVCIKRLHPMVDTLCHQILYQSMILSKAETND